MSKENEEYHQFAIATNTLKKLLIHYKIDSEALFLKAGIDPETINIPDSRVSCDKVDRLWELASQKINNPYFAIEAGKFWHPSFNSPLGHSWLAVQTLEDGIDKFSRYFHILTNAFEPIVLKTSDRLTVKISYKKKAPLNPNRIIAFVSILFRMCRFNYGDTLNPVEFHFVQPAPKDVTPFERYFKSKGWFSSDQDSLIFSMADMRAPLLSSHPALDEAYDEILQKFLRDTNNDKIVDKVAHEIAENLTSGKITDESIAGYLGMSVRSLHRKLKNEGSRFQTILDSTRKSMVMDYLKDPELSLEDIAYLSGFSEYSSFYRAFKRWTGKNPTTLRSEIYSSPILS